MKKVLLVEDDISNVELTKRLVKDICDLDVATSANQAILLANDNTYSLLLLDINLGGGKDGIQALREIRSNQKHKDIAVIVITAYAMQNDKEKINNEGIDHYIVKPIDISYFKALVKSTLS